MTWRGRRCRLRGSHRATRVLGFTTVALLIRGYACGKTWKRSVVEFGESVHCRPAGENNAMRGGDQRMLRRVCVGHHETSGAGIFFTPDGVKRGTRIARMLEHERWDREFGATCIGVPS